MARGKVKGTKVVGEFCIASGFKNSCLGSSFHPYTMFHCKSMQVFYTQINDLLTMTNRGKRKTQRSKWVHE